MIRTSRPRQFRSHLVAGAITLLLALSTAQAGDCWVSAVENPDTGFGDPISAPRHAALRQTLQQAEKVLQADPVINAIPQVRYQAHRYLGTPRYPYGPNSGEVSVYFHEPASWSGACGLKQGADVTHFLEFELQLNNLDALQTQQRVEVKDSPRIFSAPRRIGERDGYPIFENGQDQTFLVITADRIFPFTRVTAFEYLQHWLQVINGEIEERRKNLYALSKDKEMLAHIEQLRVTDPDAAAETERSITEAAQQMQQLVSELQDEREELLKRRDSLGSERRHDRVFINAAAVEHHRFGFTSVPGPDSEEQVMLNPALWGVTRHPYQVYHATVLPVPGANDDSWRPKTYDPSTIRIVTLLISPQDPERTQARDAQRWLERVDLGPYRALLTAEKK